MESAPETDDEAERIAKLQSYNVLDTMPEAVYDDIVNLATNLCDTPIALVSLIDKDRQWFKAKVGLDAPETPRDVAFCSHAIHQQNIFEINDSRLDDRFHDNPLVTGDPRVIFYAGAPLISPEGHKVGTLCVIDNEPRTLDPKQKDMLMRLSRQVAYILEQRIVSHQLDVVNQQLQTANDELSQFSYRASHDLKSPLISIRRLADFIRKDIGDQQYDEAIGNTKKVSNLASRLEDVVTNVLALHKATDTPDRSESFSTIELVQGVKEDLHWLFEDSGCQFKTDHVADFNMFHEKVRIQQIMENLVSNAVKYRDRSKETCQVEVKCQEKTDRIAIEVSDNGVGIEEKFHDDVMGMFKRFHSGLSEGSGLGLAIVKKHVDALQGSINFTSVPNSGTSFFVSLPKGLGGPP